MAGNYYPVSTRIYITVPALPLPQTGSTSQIAGAGWPPSRDPHSQSPFYLGWARTAGCGDRPLPGRQQSAGWLTRAHGERGAPPTLGFSRKAHPDPAKLEGCCWYPCPACGLGSILFPFFPFLCQDSRSASPCLALELYFCIPLLLLSPS